MEESGKALVSAKEPGTSKGSLEAILYDGGKKRLGILDQLLLPERHCYIPITGVQRACKAIKDMQVRGAPAIAIVGMLALGLELAEKPGQPIEPLIEALVSSRPTAVNLRNACEQVKEIIAEQTKNGTSQQEQATRVKEFAEKLLAEDLKINLAIGEHGADRILQSLKEEEKQRPVTVVTICNTGSLATSGYGTALGVIRSLHKRNRLEMVYFLETRPYNQGSRLTAYELLSLLTAYQIPSTLICDSMAGWLMRKRRVDAVIVGADCVARNGDVANKIGTYALAVLAKHHGVQFYAAVPTTTINGRIASGEEIVIEERPAEEMTQIRGVPIAPTDVRCWNPAFDVTPAELISGGIITEKGVFPPENVTDAIY